MKRVWLIPARDFLPLYIINASPLPAATQGVFYSTQMQANGGVAPYVWSLPATNGFTINVASGLISGTPIAAETDVLSVTVTDSLGAIVTRPFSVTVNASSSPLVITTTSPLTTAAQSSAYNFTMAATGGSPPYTWSFFTAPTGTNSWAISSAGVISGTPANIETDVLSVRVTDSLLAHTDGTFSLPVASFVPDFFPSGVNPDGVTFAGITIPDPYAGYSTWYMDKTVGVDPTPGSHQAAGYVYATLQAAVNDVFFASGLGARRLVIRANAVWNGGSATLYVYTQTTPATFPGFSGVNGTPYVVQGDPSVNGLPYFDGGAIHNGGTQSRTGGILIFTGTNAYITVRKIGAQNHCAAVFRCSGTMTHLVMEYCACHDVYYNTQGDSGVGFLASAFNQAMSTVTMRYCNIYNFGTASQNNVMLETYGSDNFTVYNNYVANIIFQLRLKLFGNGTGHADNWTVTNNIFSNGFNTISQGTQNNTNQSQTNWTISNNLFYGNFPTYGNGGSAWGCGLSQGFTTQGSGISWTNNTFGQDINNGAGWGGSTGLTYRDNLSLANTKQWSSGRSATASSDVVFATANFNAYAGGTSWHLNMDASVYTGWSQWQTAWSVPRDGAGLVIGTPPPDLAVVHDPDPLGVWIPNQGTIGGVNYGVVANNFADANFATSRNYTLATLSPLRTSSSTSGPVGCNMASANDNGTTGIGPGWFA